MAILSVVGARPQFIKAAAVSRAIAKVADRAAETIVHTGQHFDDNMSRAFFEQLRMPGPTVNLGIAGESHAVMTARMLAALEQVMLDEPPDVCVVYGDTNSTLAGALAAVKVHVPVAHVEAGLRSRNRRMAEEINRVLTDRVSSLLLCPTPAAVENLRREGIVDGVTLTGDVMYDSVLYAKELAEAGTDVLDRLGLTPRRYYLATIHRAENTDDPARLGRLLGALGAARREVILPVHPRTRMALERHAVAAGRVRLIDPVPYLEMLRLEAGARAVLTDSGGVQKEAYLAGVPCITLRDETEWVELVEAGWNRLAGTDPDAIAAAIEWAESRDPAPPGESLYGDGHAAEHIVAALLDLTVE